MAQTPRSNILSSNGHFRDGQMLQSAGLCPTSRQTENNNKNKESVSVHDCFEALTSHKRCFDENGLCLVVQIAVPQIVDTLASDSNSSQIPQANTFLSTSQNCMNKIGTYICG